MKKAHALALAALLAPLGGCSSEGTGTGTGAPVAAKLDAGGGEGAEAAEAGAEAPDAEASSDSSDTAKAVSAPVLTGVTKMGGALHIYWKNKQAGCEAVLGERKMGDAEYAVVFTVPGTVDNKMDGRATADATYTYRLRCKLGGAYSPYSNELSANPTK